MKKLSLMVIMGICFSLGFSGCAKDNGENKKEEQVPIKIGLVQIMEHNSLNTIRDTIIETLKADKTLVNVDIDYQNAQGEPSNLSTICQKFVGDKSDLIIAIATPSAQAAASVTSEIPIIFSAVTDPVAAKLMDDMTSPNKNVTGTSDDIPADQIFDLAAILTPKAKTFGFIYNAGEPNSTSVIADAKKYCDANGIKYIDSVVTNTSEVQQAAQSLVGRVDAIFTPIDNTVASAMSVLTQVAIEAKLPVYTGADSMVADGGLATVGIDYVNLGKQTAAMVSRILNGDTIKNNPVEILNEYGMFINKTTAEKIGITIPQDILDKATILE